MTKEIKASEAAQQAPGAQVAGAAEGARLTYEQIGDLYAESHEDSRRPVYGTNRFTGEEETSYEPTRVFNPWRFARAVENHTLASAPPAPALSEPVDTCQGCRGAGGTMTGGPCAECYGQGTYSGAREFVEASFTVEPTDAQIKAYLDANTEYWRLTDNLPTPPNKWRTGTPEGATRAGLIAVFALAAPNQTPAPAAKAPAMFVFKSDRNGVRYCGSEPIPDVCYWLESALKSSEWRWDDDQRECAQMALDAARSAPAPAAQGLSDAECTLRQIAIEAVRDICETDPADPGDPDTILINVNDLLDCIDAAILAASRTTPKDGA